MVRVQKKRMEKLFAIFLIQIFITSMFAGPVLANCDEKPKDERANCVSKLDKPADIAAALDNSALASHVSEAQVRTLSQEQVNGLTPESLAVVRENQGAWNYARSKFTATTVKKLLVATSSLLREDDLVVLTAEQLTGNLVEVGERLHLLSPAELALAIQQSYELKYSVYADIPNTLIEVGPNGPRIVIKNCNGERPCFFDLDSASGTENTMVFANQVAGIFGITVMHNAQALTAENCENCKLGMDSEGNVVLIIGNGQALVLGQGEITDNQDGSFGVSVGSVKFNIRGGPGGLGIEFLPDSLKVNGAFELQGSLYGKSLVLRSEGGRVAIGNQGSEIFFDVEKGSLEYGENLVRFDGNFKAVFDNLGVLQNYALRSLDTWAGIKRKDGTFSITRVTDHNSPIIGFNNPRRIEEIRERQNIMTLLMENHDLSDSDKIKIREWLGLAAGAEITPTSYADFMKKLNGQIDEIFDEIRGTTSINTGVALFSLTSESFSNHESSFQGVGEFLVATEMVGKPAEEQINVRMQGVHKRTTFVLRTPTQQSSETVGLKDLVSVTNSEASPGGFAKVNIRTSFKNHDGQDHNILLGFKLTKEEGMVDAILSTKSLFDIPGGFSPLLGEGALRGLAFPSDIPNEKYPAYFKTNGIHMAAIAASTGVDNPATMSLKVIEDKLKTIKVQVSILSRLGQEYREYTFAKLDEVITSNAAFSAIQNYELAITDSARDAAKQELKGILDSTSHDVNVKLNAYQGLAYLLNEEGNKAEAIKILSGAIALLGTLPADQNIQSYIDSLMLTQANYGGCIGHKDTSKCLNEMQTTYGFEFSEATRQKIIEESTKARRLSVLMAEYQDANNERRIKIAEEILDIDAVQGNNLLAGLYSEKDPSKARTYIDAARMALMSKVENADFDLALAGLTLTDFSSLLSSLHMTSASLDLQLDSSGDAVNTLELTTSIEPKNVRANFMLLQAYEANIEFGKAQERGDMTVNLAGGQIAELQKKLSQEGLSTEEKRNIEGQIDSLLSIRESAAVMTAKYYAEQGDSIRVEELASLLAEDSSLLSQMNFYRAKAYVKANYGETQDNHMKEIDRLTTSLKKKYDIESLDDLTDEQRSDSDFLKLIQHQRQVKINEYVAMEKLGIPLSTEQRRDYNSLVLGRNDLNVQTKLGLNSLVQELRGLESEYRSMMESGAHPDKIMRIRDLILAKNAEIRSALDSSGQWGGISSKVTESLIRPIDGMVRMNSFQFDYSPQTVQSLKDFILENRDLYYSDGKITDIGSLITILSTASSNGIYGDRDRTSIDQILGVFGIDGLSNIRDNKETRDRLIQSLIDTQIAAAAKKEGMSVEDWRAMHDGDKVLSDIEINSRNHIHSLVLKLGNIGLTYDERVAAKDKFSTLVQAIRNGEDVDQNSLNQFMNRYGEIAIFGGTDENAITGEVLVQGYASRRETRTKALAVRDSDVIVDDEQFSDAIKYFRDIGDSDSILQSHRSRISVLTQIYNAQQMDESGAAVGVYTSSDVHYDIDVEKSLIDAENAFAGYLSSIGMDFAISGTTADALEIRDEMKKFMSSHYFSSDESRDNFLMGIRKIEGAISMQDELLSAGVNVNVILSGVVNADQLISKLDLIVGYAVANNLADIKRDPEDQTFHGEAADAIFRKIIASQSFSKETIEGFIDKHTPLDTISEPGNEPQTGGREDILRTLAIKMESFDHQISGDIPGANEHSFSIAEASFDRKRLENFNSRLAQLDGDDDRRVLVVEERDAAYLSLQSSKASLVGTLGVLQRHGVGTSDGNDREVFDDSLRLLAEIDVAIASHQDDAIDRTRSSLDRGTWDWQWAEDLKVAIYDGLGWNDEAQKVLDGVTEESKTNKANMNLALDYAQEYGFTSEDIMNGLTVAEIKARVVKTNPHLREEGVDYVVDAITESFGQTRELLDFSKKGRYSMTQSQRIDAIYGKGTYDNIDSSLEPSVLSGITFGSTVEMVAVGALLPGAGALLVRTTRLLSTGKKVVDAVRGFKAAHSLTYGAIEGAVEGAAFHTGMNGVAWAKGQEGDWSFGGYVHSMVSMSALKVAGGLYASSVERSLGYNPMTKKYVDDTVQALARPTQLTTQYGALAVEVGTFAMLGKVMDPETSFAEHLVSSGATVAGLKIGGAALSAAKASTQRYTSRRAVETHTSELYSSRTKVRELGRELDYRTLRDKISIERTRSLEESLIQNRVNENFRLERGREPRAEEVTLELRREAEVELRLEEYVRREGDVAGIKISTEALSPVRDMMLHRTGRNYHSLNLEYQDAVTDASISQARTSEIASKFSSAKTDFMAETFRKTGKSPSEYRHEIGMSYEADRSRISESEMARLDREIRVKEKELDKLRRSEETSVDRERVDLLGKEVESLRKQYDKQFTVNLESQINYLSHLREVSLKQHGRGEVFDKISKELELQNLRLQEAQLLHKAKVRDINLDAPEFASSDLTLQLKKVREDIRKAGEEVNRAIEENVLTSFKEEVVKDKTKIDREGIPNKFEFDETGRINVEKMRKESSLDEAVVKKIEEVNRIVDSQEANIGSYARKTQDGADLFRLSFTERQTAAEMLLSGRTVGETTGRVFEQVIEGRRSVREAQVEGLSREFIDSAREAIDSTLREQLNKKYEASESERILEVTREALKETRDLDAIESVLRKELGDLATPEVFLEINTFLKGKSAKGSIERVILDGRIFRYGNTRMNENGYYELKSDKIIEKSSASRVSESMREAFKTVKGNAERLIEQNLNVADRYKRELDNLDKVLEAKGESFSREVEAYRESIRETFDALKKQTSSDTSPELLNQFRTYEEIISTKNSAALREILELRRSEYERKFEELNLEIEGLTDAKNLPFEKYYKRIKLENERLRLEGEGEFVSEFNSVLDNYEAFMTLKSGRDFALRPEQVRELLNYLNNPKSIAEIGTGWGKTDVLMPLLPVMDLQLAGRYNKAVVMSPHATAMAEVAVSFRNIQSLYGIKTLELSSKGKAKFEGKELGSDGEVLTLLREAVARGEKVSILTEQDWAGFARLNKHTGDATDLLYREVTAKDSILSFVDEVHTLTTPKRYVRSESAGEALSRDTIKEVSNVHSAFQKLTGLKNYVEGEGWVRSQHKGSSEFSVRGEDLLFRGERVVERVVHKEGGKDYEVTKRLSKDFAERLIKENGRWESLDHLNREIDAGSLNAKEFKASLDSLAQALSSRTAEGGHHIIEPIKGEKLVVPYAQHNLRFSDPHHAGMMDVIYGSGNLNNVRVSPSGRSTNIARFVSDFAIKRGGSGTLPSEILSDVFGFSTRHEISKDSKYISESVAKELGVELPKFEGVRKTIGQEEFVKSRAEVQDMANAMLRRSNSQDHLHVTDMTSRREGLAEEALLLSAKEKGLDKVLVQDFQGSNGRYREYVAVRESNGRVREYKLREGHLEVGAHKEIFLEATAKGEKVGVLTRVETGTDYRAGKDVHDVWLTDSATSWTKFKQGADRLRTVHNGREYLQLAHEKTVLDITDLGSSKQMKVSEYIKRMMEVEAIGEAKAVTGDVVLDIARDMPVRFMEKIIGNEIGDPQTVKLLQEVMIDIQNPSKNIGRLEYGTKPKTTLDSLRETIKNSHQTIRELDPRILKESIDARNAELNARVEQVKSKTDLESSVRDSMISELHSEIGRNSERLTKVKNAFNSLSRESQSEIMTEANTRLGEIEFTGTREVSRSLSEEYRVTRFAENIASKYSETSFFKYRGEAAPESARVKVEDKTFMFEDASSQTISRDSFRSEGIKRQSLSEAFREVPSLSVNPEVSIKVESYFAKRGYEAFYPFALAVSQTDLENAGLSSAEAKDVMVDVIAKQVMDVTQFDSDNIPTVIAKYGFDQGYVNYQDMIVSLDTKSVSNIDGIDQDYAEGITYQLVRDYFEETFLLNDRYVTQEDLGHISDGFSEMILDEYGSIIDFVSKVQDNQAEIDSIAIRFSISDMNAEVLTDWARDRVSQSNVQTVKANREVSEGSGVYRDVSQEVDIDASIEEIVIDYESIVEDHFEGRVPAESEGLIDKSLEKKTESFVKERTVLVNGNLIPIQVVVSDDSQIVYVDFKDNKVSQKDIEEGEDSIVEEAKKECSDCKLLVIREDSCTDCDVARTIDRIDEDFAWETIEDGSAVAWVIPLESKVETGETPDIIEPFEMPVDIKEVLSKNPKEITRNEAQVLINQIKIARNFGEPDGLFDSLIPFEDYPGLLSEDMVFDNRYKQLSRLSDQDIDKFFSDLLQAHMERETVEVFDYFLSLDDIDIIEGTKRTMPNGVLELLDSLDVLSESQMLEVEDLRRNEENRKRIQSIANKYSAEYYDYNTEQNRIAKENEFMDKYSVFRERLGYMGLMDENLQSLYKALNSYGVVKDDMIIIGGLELSYEDIKESIEYMEESLSDDFIQEEDDSFISRMKSFVKANNIGDGSVDTAIFLLNYGRFIEKDYNVQRADPDYYTSQETRSLTADSMKDYSLIHQTRMESLESIIMDNHMLSSNEAKLRHPERFDDVEKVTQNLDNILFRIVDELPSELPVVDAKNSGQVETSMKQGFLNRKGNAYFVDYSIQPQARYGGVMLKFSSEALLGKEVSHILATDATGFGGSLQIENVEQLSGVIKAEEALMEQMDESSMQMFPELGIRTSTLSLDSLEQIIVPETELESLDVLVEKLSSKDETAAAILREKIIVVSVNEDGFADYQAAMNNPELHSYLKYKGIEVADEGLSVEKEEENVDIDSDSSFFGRVAESVKGFFTNEGTINAEETLSSEAQSRRNFLKSSAKVLAGATAVATLGPLAFPTDIAQEPVVPEVETKEDLVEDVTPTTILPEPKVEMIDGAPHLTMGSHKAEIKIIKSKKVPYNNYQERRVSERRDADDIKYIMLHSTGTADDIEVKSIINHFNNPTSESSAQFIVDEDGSIVVMTYEGINLAGMTDLEIIDYCEKTIANHVGSKTTTDKNVENANSIGIEVLGNDRTIGSEVVDHNDLSSILNERKTFTVKSNQKESYIALTKYLMVKYDIHEENVKSHMEITGFKTKTGGMLYNKEDGVQVKADVMQRLAEDKRVLLASKTGFSEEYMDAISSSSTAKKLGKEIGKILSDVSTDVIAMISEPAVMKVLKDDSFEGRIVLDQTDVEIRISDDINDIGTNEVIMDTEGRPLITITINPDMIAKSDYSTFTAKAHEIAEGLGKILDFGYPELNKETAFVHSLGIVVEQEIDDLEAIVNGKLVSTEQLRAASYVSSLALIANKQRLFEDIGALEKGNLPSYRKEGEQGPKAKVYHKGGKSYKILFDYGDGNFQIAALDIHDFKHQVNTRYGHHGGDMYLQQTAKALERKLEGWTGQDATGFMNTKIVTDSFRTEVIDDVGELEVTNDKDSLYKQKYRLDNSELNFYVGVSKKSSPTNLAQFQKLIQDSSFAGKTAQLRDIGGLNAEELMYSPRDEAQTAIDDAKVIKGSKVLEYSPEIEQTFCCKNIQEEGERRSNPLGLIENEYEFFGERVVVRGIDNLLAKRDEAILEGDIVEQRKAEDKIMLGLITNGEFGKFLDGNDNFKLMADKLLASGGMIDYQDIFIVGGDEIGFLVSGNGKVRFARIDINNFGKTNQRYGVDFADVLKFNILKTIRSNIKADNIHETSNADLAKNINLDILKHLKDIEAGLLNKEYNKYTSTHFEEQYRPSLSIGISTVEERFSEVSPTKLNELSDGAAESIKAASKSEISSERSTEDIVSDGGFFKEAEIEYTKVPGDIARTPLEEMKIDWMLNTKDFIDFNTKFFESKFARLGKELGSQC